MLNTKMDHSVNPFLVKIIFGQTQWSFEAIGLILENGDSTMYDVQKNALEHIDICRQ
jgi:hypothetical protein